MTEQTKRKLGDIWYAVYNVGCILGLLFLSATFMYLGSRG